MEFVLEDVILPDKPIMLRWRQSENSPTDSSSSQSSPSAGGMGSFTVSLPKAASPKKKGFGGAKFVNFTASSPHEKKISQKNKEKKKNAASLKSHLKGSTKTQDKQVQRRAIRTPLDVLEPSKDKGLVARYPSPLDRYFFNTTPFPFTNLDSLNTGHYTNYCKILVLSHQRR